MPETSTQQPLEAIKVSDSVYRIEDNGVRCLLFAGTRRALLVDAGFGGSGSLKAVVGSLTDKPVTLVLTHADPDHIGNHKEFSTVHMHPSEMPSFIKNTGAEEETNPLWEGDVVDLGGRKLEVILIPGHTPGSIALLDRENHILVAGDSISSGPVFMFGDERNIYAYIASMEKLLAISDAFDLIYPSHGPFPLQAVQVEKALTAAKKLLAGELTPQKPPFPIPAKMYMFDGAGFLY